MNRISEAKKAVVAAVGYAIGLVLLIPSEQVPDSWRPWVGLLLAVGTVLGVYRATNKPQQPSGVIGEPTTYRPPPPGPRPPSRPLE